MAHKQRTPFTLKSGNKTSFKAMGSSPMQIRFASPEAGAILPQNSGINGGGYGPRPAPQTPEKMKAQEEAQKKMMMQRQARAQQGLNTTGGSGQAQPTINPQQAMGDLFNQASKAVPQGPNTMRDRPMPTQQHGTYQDAEAQARAQNQKNSLLEKAVQQGPNTMGGYKGLNQQGPNTIMNAQAPAQAAVQSAPRTQAPQAAVQSAPRPDLSGGPRQPMGRPTGGPGQLPPNKGRRRPSTGPGMGRARRATGLARRARRATGLARRVRRSRG
jgi:hypothetical protein